MPVELRSENGPKVSESKGGGAAAAVRESPASPVVGGLHYGPETYILVADAGRLYRQVRQNGTLRRVTAILFPWNYAFPIQGSLMRWVCPVDTCDLESGKLLGLSKHWRVRKKESPDMVCGKCIEFNELTFAFIFFSLFYSRASTSRRPSETTLTVPSQRSVPAMSPMSWNRRQMW